MNIETLTPGGSMSCIRCQRHIDLNAVYLVGGSAKSKRNPPKFARGLLRVVARDDGVVGVAHYACPPGDQIAADTQGEQQRASEGP